MMTGNLRTIAVGASIGAGLIGGVLLAFSTFVMRALGNLPSNQGLAAMQSINRYAPNPLFMAVLFGTAAACVPLGISAARHLDEPPSPYLLAGSGLYLAGIVLTAAYHVPHNDALALLDPNAPTSADAWRTYLHDWSLWNHVRTATSIGGAVALAIAATTGRC